MKERCRRSHMAKITIMGSDGWSSVCRICCKPHTHGATGREGEVHRVWCCLSGWVRYWEVGCPTCGARKKEWCYHQITGQRTKWPHPARFRVAERLPVPRDLLDRIMAVMTPRRSPPIRPDRQQYWDRPRLRIPRALVVARLRKNL